MTPTRSFIFLAAVGLVSASAACSSDHSTAGTVVYFALLLSGVLLGLWSLYGRRA